MTSATQAPSFRILVCAAMALIITVLSTQAIVRLASEPSHVAASDLPIAQDGTRAGSITVAMR
jgi:hypothetical protein